MPSPTSDWHLLDADETLKRLDVDGNSGLCAKAVATRLQQYGTNSLKESESHPLWLLFLEQFRDFMIAVLLAAALISGLVGETVDTFIILLIIILNAAIGTFQEHRAEKAVAALKKMSAPHCRVLRDGQTGSITIDTLVPGDIVLLEAGDIVPADLRLFDSSGLESDESALTGESQPVAKQCQALDDAKAALADRRNMLYKGTFVTKGGGRAVVTATGMATELGKIAALLKGADEVKTPLQKRLANFGRRLAYSILVICAVIFVAGLLRGEAPILMLLTAISLAVAAIPEALPAVVSIALALGAARLSKVKALIRRLPSVETLGSVTYICSDKTGTLTRNRMKVETIHLDGFSHEVLIEPGSATPQHKRLAQTLLLNNDTQRGPDDVLHGEATELALWQCAVEAGYDPEGVRAELPRLTDLPFDFQRKRMTTLHAETGGGYLALVKGAPEQIIAVSTRHFDGSPVDPALLLNQAKALAGRGFRVLALAQRRFDHYPDAFDSQTIEQQLTYLGMVGLLDPPREGVTEAVAECLSAGIVPVMITGDHPETARSIARRLGIIEDGGVLTGQALEALSEDEFKRLAPEVRVYARVTPEQKIRIVRVLQQLGEYVAMTGDGVNDAPALKQADIGIAMGRKGTDVAREAADMVLLDDNFSTIVAAIREGRRCYDNIRKFIRYTMTSNSGEIWTLFLAPFFGLPLPLLPIHILWINLVTDGLPGLALSAEPAERNIMQRPPRRPGESIFAGGMWQQFIWVGLLIGGLSLGAQAWSYHGGSSHWQTVVFTVLTVSQLFNALALRSETQSIFSLGLLSNRALLGAVLLTLALQLAVIYLPFFNEIFKTQPLTLTELGVCLALSSLVLVALEIEKYLIRRGWLYSKRISTTEINRTAESMG